jgi:hypothetical protein
MTNSEVQKAFDDMGLGTEAVRERFRSLSRLGVQEDRPPQFIYQDSVSAPIAKVNQNAELAPVARRNQD